MQRHVSLSILLALSSPGIACSGPGGNGGGGGPAVNCATNPTHPFCSQTGADAKTGVDGSTSTNDGAPATGNDATAASDTPAGGDTGVPCVPACGGKACGSDGCGGLCGSCGAGTTCAEGQCIAGECGAGGATVQGTFKVAGGIDFDAVTVLVTHKMDVDAFEDGCLTYVEIAAKRGFGCTLLLKAGAVEDPTGGLRVTELAFSADSQCPGFPDANEGEYASITGLKVAKVVSSTAKVPDKNAPESCLQTSFKVELSGKLASWDGKALDVGSTSLIVAGEFKSAGSTTADCPCKPACTGKQCGSDGCGFECGFCSGAQDTCSAAGKCECQPYCDWGAECGDDGCAGSCGTCGVGETCEETQCVACEPKCDGKKCGDNGCGGSCGTCAANQECLGGLCVETCQPNCLVMEKQCGDDGCGGSCGTCTGGKTCNASGFCAAACTPKTCTGLGYKCGSWSDGCDGTLSCGTCTGGKTCNASGQCATACTPDCDLFFKECGDDGCGGSCGSCAAGSTCDASGSCVADGGCGGISWEGCCDGTTLFYCNNDTLTTYPCTTSCGWSADGGFYDCELTGSDPSGVHPKTCP